MPESTVFMITNDILNSWSDIAVNEPKSFIQNLNDKSVVVTVLKQTLHTQFTVQEDGKQCTSGDEPPASTSSDSLTLPVILEDPDPQNTSPAIRPSKKRSACSISSQQKKMVKKHCSNDDICREPCMKRDKRHSGQSDVMQSPRITCKGRRAEIQEEPTLAAKFDLQMPVITPCEGIKSRLRHPGVSPLLRLGSDQWLEEKWGGKYGLQSKRSSRTEANRCRSERGTAPKRKCLLCEEVFSRGDASQSALESHLYRCHMISFDDQYKVIEEMRNSARKRKLLKELQEQSDKEHLQCQQNSPRREQVEEVGGNVLMNNAGHHSDEENQFRARNEEVVEEGNKMDPDKDKGPVTVVQLVPCSSPKPQQSSAMPEFMGDGITDKDLFEAHEKKTVADDVAGKTPLSPSTNKHSEMGSRKVDYVIEDSVLAEMGQDYTGCLLCGRVFRNTTKLSTHLYFCHKVTCFSHHEVLELDGLEKRREALSKLREKSKEQMILSGKHCPVCFIGMLNAKNLIHHMVIHAAHPQYHAYLSRLKQNMELSEQYRSLSNMHVRKKGMKKGKNHSERHCPEDDLELSLAGRDRVVCCICEREFVSGAQLRKHLNTLHLLAWVDYIALNMLGDEAKESKIKLIKQRRMTRYDCSVKARHADYEHQIIDCTKCGDSIPCQKYREHLEVEHPGTDDIDGIIGEMERVLAGAASGQQNVAVVKCPYCEIDLQPKQVQRHMKLAHRDEADFSAKLHQIGLEMKYLFSKIRHSERKERVALKIRLVCRYCGTPFTDQSTRSFHENYSCVKNDKRKQRYTCKFCGHRGTSEEWFRNHIKQHNPDGPNYICSLCGNGYMNKSGLDSHKAKDHRNVKRYTCAQCDKQFYVSSHYKSHMLKHSAKRAFECHLCKKKFKSASSMKRHIKTVHYAHEENKERVQVTNTTDSPLTDDNRDKCAEQQSWQIKPELGVLESMEPLNYVNQRSESLRAELTRSSVPAAVVCQPELEPSGFVSAECQLPSSAAEERANVLTASVSMTGLQNGVQEESLTVHSITGMPGESSHAETTGETIYVEHASEMDDQPMDDIHCWPAPQIQMNTSGTAQCTEDVPLRYLLDETPEGVRTVSGGTMNADAQTVVEIYIDESGNIIGHAPDIWQIQQIVDTSQIQQMVDTSQIQQ